VVSGARCSSVKVGGAVVVVPGSSAAGVVSVEAGEVVDASTGSVCRTPGVEVSGVEEE